MIMFNMYLSGNLVLTQSNGLGNVINSNSYHVFDGNCKLIWTAWIQNATAWIQNIDGVWFVYSFF